MAGSKLVRFLLIRNNSSCKTPEADYPWAFLPALEALTSCQASEEDYPMAFLPTSEVSHPPKLPKNTTQGLSFKHRKSHLLPYFRRRLPKGFPSYLGCSRLLPYFRRRVPDGLPPGLGSSHFLPGFRRRLPEGVITPRQEAAEC